jgi:hypothetical protein
MPHKVIDQVQQLSQQQPHISNRVLDDDWNNHTDINHLEHFNVTSDAEDFDHVTGNDDIIQGAVNDNASQDNINQIMDDNRHLTNHDYYKASDN